MKKSVWLLGVLLLPVVASAKDKPAVAVSSASATPTSALPLRQVVLFSSGVGYFGREGRVTGGEVTMNLAPGQVNDVLKSLVLFDPSGGVQPITYSVADFLSSRPREADLRPNASASLGGILQGFQGALVRLGTGGAVVEGRILSVNTRNINAKEGQTVQAEFVNLLTRDGLQSVRLDDVAEVKLLDDALNLRLRGSLERLGANLTAQSDDGKRPVRLHFADGALRQVRAGYLQEMPVWKTSYRLVLDDKGAPFLQGWGQIENTTDEDWRNVSLSLVSGRPISFIQDLYQPLYVPRPIVASQIGSTIPQTYGPTLVSGGVAGQSDELEARRGGGFGGNGAAFDFSTTPRLAPARRNLAAGILNRAGNAGYINSNNLQENQVAQDAAVSRGEIAASAEQLANSAAAQASGSERGELFEYAIAQPISVPRGEAAMVPIVSESVGGENLSIYDAQTNAKSALLGLRFVNTSKLHLAGGPLTVYREGIYAGDAQVTDLAPGEGRLISYAVDQDLVVAQRNPDYDQTSLTLKAVAGVLYVTRSQKQTVTYVFRNKSAREKTVIVLRPVDANVTVLQPQKPEQTATQYRFRTVVAPRKSAELVVVTQRPITESIALLDSDLDTIFAYSKNAELSPALKTALTTLIAKRRAISTVVAQRAGLEQELKEISTEQERIRQNMERLDRTSALYKEYVAKLTAQETRIERIKTELVRLRRAETEARQELRAYLDSLNVA